MTFYWYPQVNRLRHAVLFFDAAGLGLFAVTGAHKALAYHLGPVPAALLGMLTGIGGGIVRDLLVSQVPAVFRTDIYAAAALAGALLCFAIRLTAINRGWQFPIARTPE